MEVLKVYFAPLKLWWVWVVCLIDSIVYVLICKD